jgi:ABC-type branched-subunit amino acid transport system ATPase component
MSQALVELTSLRKEPVLQVRGITKRFGGVTAVDDVTFEIHPGTITGLIGPNGAGKSTALGIVAGAIRADGGHIEFLGTDVSGLPTFRRSRLGLVRTFQVSSEFGRLTLLENLVVSAPQHYAESMRASLWGPRAWRRHEEELIERAIVVLTRFGMRDKANEYAGNLSGGQKRILEIMRGLMAEPKLLLLDEPMSGVNPSLIRQIEEHLVMLQEAGLAMILVEHELSVVGRLCGNVVVMAMGRILAEGTMDQLRGNDEVVDAYLAG